MSNIVKIASNYIVVPAWRIRHTGGEFFTFVINSSELLKIAYVSTDERDKGVQRPLSEKRCKDVAKYIDSTNGILANNIILNLPKETKYIEEESGGVLRIPNTEKSAWVVDGQHRLYGFQYSHNSFDLLCSAFINLDIDKQADIFITINKEQKGISTSVIYDLLPLVKNGDYKKMRAQSLVKQLNEEPESPWFNEVKMLGVGKGLVSQSTFAQNIEKLIDPNGGALASYNEQYQFRILLNYFIAFKALFPKEWGSNKYILTKTVGLSAMCGIFPKIHELCNKDLTVDNILKIIENLSSFDFSSYTLGKSTNKVAIQNVIRDLLEKLPDISTTTDIKI